MFFKFLSFFEHRFRGDVVCDFQPRGLSVQNVEEDSACRTLRVLLANGNRQVPLAFFDRLQYRFGNSQGRRTDVSERPEPLKYNGDTDDRQKNQRIGGDGAFVDDVNEIQTLWLHDESFRPARRRLPEREI